MDFSSDGGHSTGQKFLWIPVHQTNFLVELRESSSQQLSNNTQYADPAYDVPAMGTTCASSMQSMEAF